MYDKLYIDNYFVKNQLVISAVNSVKAAVIGNMAEVAVNSPIDEVVDASQEEFDISTNLSNSPSESKENFGVVANGVPAVNDRLKRRAKRPSKFLSKELTRTNSDSNVVAPLRALKNSRKSRNGFGRGLPKKGKTF